MIDGDVREIFHYHIPSDPTSAEHIPDKTLMTVTVGWLSGEITIATYVPVHKVDGSGEDNVHSSNS